MEVSKRDKAATLPNSSAAKQRHLVNPKSLEPHGLKSKGNWRYSTADM